MRQRQSTLPSTKQSATPTATNSPAAGADLFIINMGDIITDFQFGKPKTNKDGDVFIKDGVVTA